MMLPDKVNRFNIDPHKAKMCLLQDKGSDQHAHIISLITALASRTYARTLMNL